MLVKEPHDADFFFSNNANDPTYTNLQFFHYGIFYKKYIVCLQIFHIYIIQQVRGYKNIKSLNCANRIQIIYATNYTKLLYWVFLGMSGQRTAPTNDICLVVMTMLVSLKLALHLSEQHWPEDPNFSVSSIVVFTGIFAYLNFLTPRRRSEIIEILLNGLKRLEYRGYDSAGQYGVSDHLTKCLCNSYWFKTLFFSETMNSSY